MNSSPCIPPLSVITGANNGFGLALAKLLLLKGHEVVFACRRVEAADKEISQLDSSVTATGRAVAMKLDLADLESVVAFVAEFEENYTNKGRHLSYLVLNAGVVKLQHDRTKQGFEETYGVNHFGGAALFNLLLERVLIPSRTRVVAVGSMIHSSAKHVNTHHDLTGNTNFSTFNNYAASKLFNTLWALHANKLYSGRGVTVTSGHPGSGLFTGLGRGDASPLFKAAITPVLYLLAPLAWAVGHFQTWHDGGVAELAMCEYPEGGVYFDKHRRATPSQQALDVQLQSWLWDRTQVLLLEVSSKYNLTADISLANK